MPTYYADDYEKITGLKLPTDDDEVVAKVVTAPDAKPAKKGPQAVVKAKP